ncbi:unnamed protein product [Rotaria sp. Silwood2]|nr:unnamed protein product [Rotaria sp. Silwood2]CAF2740999.1 unnamed protein product [Rotaria sp. Silwood2]CAF3186206.1 unnamed protein product [Rotaria sp. Silwood2]
MLSSTYLFSVCTISLSNIYIFMKFIFEIYFYLVVFTINLTHCVPADSKASDVIEYKMNAKEIKSKNNDQKKSSNWKLSGQKASIKKREYPTEGILLGKREYPTEGILLGKRQHLAEGILLGKREYPTEGILLGKRHYPTEGILLGKRQYPTEGILLGKRGYPTEGILLGKRGYPTEGILLGKRGYPTEGILLGKRSTRLSESKSSEMTDD